MNPAQCYAASVYPEMYGAKKPPRQQTRARFHFTEFVRPDGYWPQPYSLEQAFQVYRWLVKTAEPFSQHGKYGAYDTLIGGGVMGSTTLHHNPIRSVDMLRRVFHRALLGRSNGSLTTAWRQKHSIAVGGCRTISFPHYVPFVGAPVLGNILSEAQVQKLVGAYLGASGHLTVQLNKFHPEAIDIWGCFIRIQTWEPYQFEFVLCYGCDGSSWDHRLASGVQFIDTLGAALTEFERVSGQRLLDTYRRPTKP